MPNKNYINRTTCIRHEECQENEYCDQYGYCWFCSEYDDYCDSIDTHCPSYCSDYGMHGECPECTALGDINQDGLIDILDVVMLVGAVLNTTELDATQFTAADMNGDGILNVSDVVILVNQLVARGEISQTEGQEIINKLKFKTEKSKVRGGTGNLMGGSGNTMYKKRAWKRRKVKRKPRRGRDNK